MAKTTYTARQVGQALGEQLLPVVDLPKISLPTVAGQPGYTTVVNRAKCTDFANDLMPKFGVDRIMTQQIMAVPGETGPNGQPVFKPVNDIHDQVRLYGTWGNGNGVNGQFLNDGASGGVVEISFFGTGLNLLTLSDDAGTDDARATVDGGAEGLNFLSAGSTTLSSRNYSPNNIVPVVSGLAQGLHTVKIRQVAASLYVYGFEIINASSTITLPPGTSYLDGKKLVKSATSTDAFNSNFESGVLGTRGGHVLVYQKSDGSVTKAVTPTDAAAAYLTSANHANEEIIRTYNWREFGAGRADDFSTNTPTAAAFTLDDGVTTLVATNSALGSLGISGIPSIPIGANGRPVTLTFVGTGIDLEWEPLTAGTASLDVAIDGVVVTGSPTTTSTRKLAKIASGLPYGAHTLRIDKNSGSAVSVALLNFVVYAPKLPTLPTGAVALADYFVMANYTLLNLDAGIALSTGVLAKMPMREMIYSGAGWNNGGILASQISGYRLQSSVTTNDYFEYTFFGTGIEFGMAVGGAGTPVVKVKIDGVDYTGSASTSTFNVPPVWTPGTSTFTGAAGYAGKIAFTNLSSGVPAKHTIRFTVTTASGDLILSSLNVITPIHAPKLNGPFVVQNTLSVGSQAIRDLRQLSPLVGGQQKMTAQATGIVSGSATTSPSTTPVPLPDMELSIKTSGNPIQITFEGSFINNTSGCGTKSMVYVDGVLVGTPIPDAQSSTASNAYFPHSHNLVIPVSPGFHLIQMYWGQYGGGTATLANNERKVNVREL